MEAIVNESKKIPSLEQVQQTVVAINDCIRDLEIIAKASEPEDLANRVQYLPL